MTVPGTLSELPCGVGRAPEGGGPGNEVTLYPTPLCAPEVVVKTPPGWEEKEENTSTLFSMKTSNKLFP